MPTLDEEEPRPRPRDLHPRLSTVQVAFARAVAERQLATLADAEAALLRGDREQIWTWEDALRAAGHWPIDRS